MKICAKCGAEKAPDQFYSDKSRSDGLSSRCVACITIDRTVYRSANREKLRLGASVDRKRTPERGCWHVMIARCHNDKNERYPEYGGSGISVCQRWRDSFEDFLADMGPRPSLQHSLDRYPDQRGNYEPGNVRWATAKQQSRNQRTNRMVTAFGRTQCMAAWAEEFGVKNNLIKDRIDRLGWDVERAISEPPHGQPARTARVA